MIKALHLRQIRAVSLQTDLFASGGRSFGFHRVGFLLTGRFGPFALLFFGRKRRVAGGTGALAVFGGIWRERGLNLAPCHTVSRPLRCCPEETYWFRSRPFSVWILGSSRGRWRRGPLKRARRHISGRKTARCDLCSHLSDSTPGAH